MYSDEKARLAKMTDEERQREAMFSAGEAHALLRLAVEATEILKERGSPDLMKVAKKATLRASHAMAAAFDTACFVPKTDDKPR